MVSLNVRGLSDADLERVSGEVLAEVSRRARVRQSEADWRAAVEGYREAVRDSPVRDVGARKVGPGERVRFPSGVFLNTSDSWLDPRTSGPLVFSAGWERIPS